jgi:radical SAM superfamily enzyme YgiQ (UPF0313 family)
MKIGFVAMSGIRAYNKELMEFGLTLPGFVERSNVIASLPSLGLLTLAGMTPPSFEVEYVEVPELESLHSLPGGFDAVAISSFSAQIKEAYALADRYRAAGVKAILGGPHVTALPGEASPHADTIVLGEGEPLWPHLLHDLERNQLQPVYDARGMSFDLARSPMPRFDLLDPSKYNRLTVQTHRGCPLECEFCAASIRMSPRFKTKPVANVIAEIRRIKEIWNRPFIEFADDNTFANSRHGKELVRALIPEGIRWFTETDISVAQDEKLLRMMKESGCAQILVGLESPVAEGLEGLELHTNWKRKQLDHYREAIEKIQESGITVNGCFVLGLDNTDTSSFERIWEFVNDSGLFEVQITVLTAFPGTPLYSRLKEEGRILHDGMWEMCTLFDVNFRPSNMSVSDLESGLRTLGERLYNAEFTASRRKRFFDRLRKINRNPTINQGGNIS